MKQVVLTQGKSCWVDDADWEYLLQWKWFAVYRKHCDKWYAGRSVGKGASKRVLLMSRVILGLTDPKVHAEHKNGDTLDNRRENLRAATNVQNQANAGPRKNNVAGVRGVRFEGKKWIARIRVDGKNVILGGFLTKEEAAEAYRQKAVELYGEFAK